MIIGITGCPGSGKTVLAHSIAELDWVLVDADEIGREVVEDDHRVLEQLADVFGNDILRGNGTLDRRCLARKAFGVHSMTEELNRIVHPSLIERIRSRILELRDQGSDAVVDCSLIFEWGIESLFDVVVAVQARESIRKERLQYRDDRNPEEIEGMFAAQFAESEKVQRADIVFSNNGDIDRIKAFGQMLSELPRYFGDR